MAYALEDCVLILFICKLGVRLELKLFLKKAPIFR